jgi:hypothetical protein
MKQRCLGGKGQRSLDRRPRDETQRSQGGAKQRAWVVMAGAAKSQEPGMQRNTWMVKKRGAWVVKYRGERVVKNRGVWGVKST